MKRIITISIVFFSLCATAQIGGNPSTFKNGIKLPNASEDTSAARIPVMDGDGVIQNYILKSSIGGGGGEAQTLAIDSNYLSISDGNGVTLPLGGDVTTGQLSDTAEAIREDIPNIPFVQPEDFGAVGDGVTDDRAAIQAAINSGVAVWFGQKTYAFSAQLTNPDVVPMLGSGILLFTGSGEDALIIGAADGNAHQPNDNTVSNVRVHRSAQDWSDEYAGVVVANCFGCQISISVEDFYIGAQLLGYDRGCTYNDIKIGVLRNNQISLQMRADGADGYVNENIISNGRYTTSSSTSDVDDVIGVDMVNNSSDNNFNNNLFLKPTFEMKNTGGGDIIAIRGSGTSPKGVANGNTFQAVRIEGGVQYILAGRGISNNIISIGYGLPYNTVNDTLIKGATLADNMVLSNNKITGTKDDNTLMTIASFSNKQFVARSSDGQVYAPSGVAFLNSGGGLFKYRNATLTDDYVAPSSQRALGVMIDFTLEPRLRKRKVEVRITSKSGNIGRLAVMAYDTSGTAILNDTSAVALDWSASAGYYRTGSDGGAMGKFVVGAGNDVAKMFIGGSGQITTIEYLVEGDSKIILDRRNDLGVEAFGVPLCDVKPKAPTAGHSYPTAYTVRDINGGFNYSWRWNGTSWEKQGRSFPISGNNVFAASAIVDIDTLKTYAGRTASASTGYPPSLANGNGFIYSLTNTNDYGYQTFSPLGDKEVFQRRKASGTWGPWYQIYSTNDFFIDDYLDSTETYNLIIANAGTGDVTKAYVDSADLATDTIDLTVSRVLTSTDAGKYLRFNNTDTVWIDAQAGIMNSGQKIEFTTYKFDKGGRIGLYSSTDTLKDVNGNVLDSVLLPPLTEVYYKHEGVFIIKAENGNKTGWAYYADDEYTSGSPYVIAEDDTATIPINAATTIDTYLPFGVTSFWSVADSTVTPQFAGDDYAISLRFKCTASANNAGVIMYLDIGGSQGIILSDSRRLLRGAGSTENRINFELTPYALQTFKDNGGKIRIEAVGGDLSLYDMGIKISKISSAQ